MKSILIAVTQQRYARLETILEDNYALSANIGNQELVLDGIPKFKPDALLIDMEIKGTRSFDVFYEVLTRNHPTLKVVVVQDELMGFIRDYIEGDREIPVYSSSAIAAEAETSAALEEAVATVEATDAAESKEDNFAKKWMKRILPNNDGKLFSDEEMLEDEDDWELTASATNDIHNYLRRVIVVTGASGGVGKTEIAINLATYAASCGFKVVLCGFNLQNDDIAGRLGLEYRRGKKLMTAFELYAQNRLNFSSLEDCLQEYRGMKVLIGIEKPEERQEMSEEFFEQTTRILKANYDLVILDTENNSYSPAYFSVIQIADHVFVPCTTHNSVLEQARDELFSWKDDFNIPLAKVDMIFNKKGEGGFIGRDHIEKYTTREVIAEVPYSKEILRGSEREEPAVLRSSMDGARIRKQFDKILFRITGKKMKNTDFIKPRFTEWRRRMKAFVKASTRG